MLASKSNEVKEVLGLFVEARRKGKLAFLVGAGLSRDHPASRPLATEISQALVEGLWASSSIARKRWGREIFLQWSSQVRFESLVQLAANTTGTVRFLRVLKGGRPNSLHRAVARALAEGCPVLTTNFDRLIERAHPKSSYLDILISSEDFRKRARKTPRGILAKLHGSIEVEESICASLNQVGALGPAFMWDPPRGEYLARARRKFPMVVLGYSGADDADVIPRLRITESEQLLLWVLHEESPLRLAKLVDIKRLATAPGLLELLDESGAVVLVGPTRTVLAMLEGRRPPPSPAPTKLERLSDQVLRHMALSSAPLIHDFLLARILYEAGHPEDSTELFGAIRSTAKAEEPEIAARCLINEATAETDLGNWTGALEKLHAALPEVSQWADKRTYANACLNRAVILRHVSDRRTAEQTFRLLLKAFRNDSELQQEWARAASNLADILFEEGKLDEAQRFLKRIRRIYKAVGDQSGLATVFGTYAKILFARDDAVDALGVLGIALWHARVAWNRAIEARLLNHMGTIQRTLGRLDEATESFKKARRLGSDVGDPEPVVVSQMGMVTVDLAVGELGRAVRRAKRCLKTGEQLGLRSLAAQTRGNLALALLESGRAADALSHFKRILKIFQEDGPPDFEAFTLRNIGECLYQLGRPGEAKETLERAVVLYERLGLREKARETKGLLRRTWKRKPKH